MAFFDKVTPNNPDFVFDQFSMFLFDGDIARHAIEEFGRLNLIVLFNMLINQIHHADHSQRTNLGVMWVVNAAGNIAVGIDGFNLNVLVKTFYDFM
jgi:predicted DNA repair protein MutK